MHTWHKYLVSICLLILMGTDTFAQVAPPQTPTPPTATGGGEDSSGDPLVELTRRQKIREHKAKLKALELALPEPTAPVVAKPKPPQKPRVVILPPLPDLPPLRAFGRRPYCQQNTGHKHLSG